MGANKKQYEETWDKYKLCVLFTGQLQTEPDSTRVTVAEKVGISTSQYDRYMRFNELEEKTKDLVRRGLSSVTALEILGTGITSIDQQREVRRIIEEEFPKIKKGKKATQADVLKLVKGLRMGKTWREMATDFPGYTGEYGNKKASSKQHKCAFTECLDDTYDMDGEQFEAFIASLLKALKYQKVDTTVKSDDNGADILAVKDGVKYVFQCKKRNKNKKVLKGAV